MLNLVLASLKESGSSCNRPVGSTEFFLNDKDDGIRVNFDASMLACTHSMLMNASNSDAARLHILITSGNQNLRPLVSFMPMACVVGLLKAKTPTVRQTKTAKRSAGQLMWGITGGCSG
eukprot:3791633-Rhodomonas_salina.2